MLLDVYDKANFFDATPYEQILNCKVSFFLIDKINNENKTKVMSK